MAKIAPDTNVANPAAGPLTLKGELLKAPTTKPPTIPAIRPLNGVAPLAIDIPKQRGSATKNTTKPAGISLPALANKRFFVIINKKYKIM